MKELFNLHLFDGNTQVTTQASLTDEMKVYYSKYLISLAEPMLVHDQFAQKHDIPANGGKVIEFRKFDSLPKALTPLVEGVTPDGQSMSVSKITAEVSQYGGYITLSDVLEMTAIDPVQTEATELIASQAGRTLDTVTREVLQGGTNVMFPGNKIARTQLTGSDKITVVLVKKAVAALKRVNAPKIGGYYSGIIHPDIEFDLTEDPDWKEPHKYVDTENIYSNEIGAIAGVRFVDSSEAKIFGATPLYKGADGKDVGFVTASSVSGKTITFQETITNAEAQAMAGKFVDIAGVPNKIASATTNSMTLTDAVSGVTSGTRVWGSGAGADGRSVYGTLIMGANAYGTTSITGLGLQYIAKQRGSAGTADPLDQRSTVGWKASKVSERLIEQYLIRLETCSEFNTEAN